MNNKIKTHNTKTLLKSILTKRVKTSSADISDGQNLKDPSTLVSGENNLTNRLKEFDDGYEKTNVGVKSLIEATKKLKAINQGLTEPDTRDSLKYKRVYNTDDLLSERTRMDAGKVRNQIMFKLSRNRSFKHFPSNVFDEYMTGHIIGNPLSLPSEEINPLYINDQMSRITAFGPGGLSSSDSVTSEAQNVHPSIFGFIDPVVGPESEKSGVDVRIASNTMITNNGKLLTKVRNVKTGKSFWMSPDELEQYTIGFAE